MTDQHRATPEQWALIAETAGGCMSATILELRSRVKALEAAQLEQAESNRFCTDAIVRRVEALEAPMTELRAASAEVRPTVKDSLTDGGGLVERVALTRMNPPLDEDDLKYACAAIREVAAWLRDNDRADLAGWLEQEANQ